jgi:N-acetylglutamate synthase-like GNAT family acetyltransferase
MPIRKATDRDIPLIMELAQKTWWPTYTNVIPDEQINFMLEDMYSEESLKKQMESGIEFIITERENIPTGFAAFSQNDTDKQVFKIHKLYVLPSEQGRGTGKELINYISASAKKLGGNTLELNVNRGNNAQNFYLKSGFSIFQTVDIPYHQFVLNDYVMRKTI